jgi:hypothetical protein
VFFDGPYFLLLIYVNTTGMMTLKITKYFFVVVSCIELQIRWKTQKVSVSCIYVLKQSVAFTVPIFVILTRTDTHYVQISCTD